MKTPVAAELFGLQMNMTTRWKDDSHEHDGISFALPQVSREVTLKVTHTNEWKYGGNFVPTKIRG
jgi:hypothetical protein